MQYIKLVKVYQELEKTTKRLEKTKIISNFIKDLPKEELQDIIYLLQGRIFPLWDERKIGFSSRLMLKALATVMGTTTSKIESSWTSHGDLGLVAEKLLHKKTQVTIHKKELTVKHVLENIRKLPTLEGEGSISRRTGYITELLSNAEPQESKYIVKIVLENLRIGIAEGVIRDSIAQAFNKEVKDISEAADKLVDYGEVAILAKENKLGRVYLKSGRPLKLMLALLSKGIPEAFESLGKPAQFEFKLDGFRLAIHKNVKEIRLFTRNMEDVTKQFPDVVSVVKKNVKGRSFILDCEIVGFDKKTGKHVPFQKISQRIKRKYEIDRMIEELPVEISVFDLILYNDKSLMNENLKERRKILERIVHPINKKIVLTKKLITSSTEKAEEFYKKALESGMEGIMVKNFESKYRSGRYVNGWVKLKDILEPVDLTITKCLWGEGKRVRWLSSYTIACKKEDKFLEIGKVSTGVKEKSEGLTYKEMTKLLKPLIIEQKGKEVTVKPKIIIEVGYEEIQKSNKYLSGYALRFPRLLRLRPDKNLNELTTLSEVKKIFRSQRKG